jgi:hypothetical protein
MQTSQLLALAAAAALLLAGAPGCAATSRRQLAILYSVQSGAPRQTANENTLNTLNRPLGNTLCLQKMNTMATDEFTVRNGRGGACGQCGRSFARLAACQGSLRAIPVAV